MDGLVLVIDDSATVREDVRRVLTNAGFSVTLATDGADALRKLVAGAAPRLIVCDVHMPLMGGLEFLEGLRAKGIAIPVVMLTADRQAEVMERARALGARGWLAKPVEPEVLIRAATKLVAGEDLAGEFGAR